MKEADANALRTTRMPQVLWIELTSRCPFDCIFCTRASLRGSGQLMDMDLYRRLIAELDRPQIIRLNYAGESGHHPQLAEAVALAAQTGSEVELVTALASIKPERLIAALEAGITRLTVSLHTLDAEQFEQIYRFSSLSSFLHNFDVLLDWQQRNPGRVSIDLAFVAMWRNLDQLPALAQFAVERGVGVLALHPLIGRDPLPIGPASEHDIHGNLETEFRCAVDAAVREVRQRHPGLAVQVSSHECSPPGELGSAPRPWPGALPDDAVISHCDQSPFETVHVLSDGRVVPCEVMEQRAMGRLSDSTLAAIWQSETYAALRRDHRAGHEKACNRCIYKHAHRPSAATGSFEAESMPAEQALYGWYSTDGSGYRWGSARSAFWLPRDARARHLRLEGVIAPGWPDAAFEIRVDGESLHRQTTSGAVQLRLALPPPAREWIMVELRRHGAASPAQLGLGSDIRELGFALNRVALD